jgi:hypothetical protein
MNKEIKDRLDKLENELKESKNEIHNLKSSVSFIIERGIRKLLSRFSRKQIILGSVIALFSITIIGIAGTVTKTYTFSSGEVVSASKFNTNFDTLFTLVNGNLDDSNISGISGSKITSGTVAAARLDNLSGSKITSGTVAAARIDNLSASMITSGTLSGDRLDNISDSKIYGDTIVFYPTKTLHTGNLGGRSGADTKCVTAKKHWLLAKVKSNFKALISVSSSDEIRDMVANYNVPSSAPIISPFNSVISDNFSDLIDGTITTKIEKHFISIEKYAFTGSNNDGSITSNHCDGWTSTSGSATHSDFTSASKTFSDSSTSCSDEKAIICIAF